MYSADRVSHPSPLRTARGLSAILVASAVLVSGSLVASARPAHAAELAFGISAEIAFDSAVQWLAVDESAGTVYASSDSSRDIRVVNESTHVEGQKITLEANGGKMAVDSGSHRLYVANYTSSTLSAVDTRTGRTVFRVPAGSFPRAIALSDDGSQVWLVNASGDSVTVLDSENGSAIAASIRVGESPVGIAIDDSAGRVYVTNTNDDTVTVIDAATLTVVDNVPVGRYPSAVLVDPSTHKVYVGHRASRSVSVIDPATLDDGLAAESLTTPFASEFIALDSASNDLVVMGAYEYEIAAVDRDDGSLSYSHFADRTGSITVDASTNTIFAVRGEKPGISVITKGEPPTIGSLPLLPGGAATVPYSSEPIPATGAGTLTWYLQGAYPAGLLASSRGIYGTPYREGDYDFTILARNAFGDSVVSAHISVAPQPLAAPVFGEFYAYNVDLHDDATRYIEVTGHPKPTVVVKGLPSGLKVIDGGSSGSNSIIVGTVKKLGKFPLTITATNSSGSVSKKVTLVVTGRGETTSYIGWVGGGSHLQRGQKAAIRELAESLPPRTTIQSLKIVAYAHSTGHYWKDLRKAKGRAWAMSSYLRHEGIKGAREYTYKVAKDRYDYTVSRIELTYTYK